MTDWKPGDTVTFTLTGTIANINDGLATKEWVLSTDVSFHTKQAYKRSIIDLHELVDRSISEMTEQDIEAYAFALQSSGRSESTVRRAMTPIRAYWRFAHSQQQ